MRLILIRHGQTPANVDGVLESTVPGPGLTALGEDEAAALPATLANEKIGAIFASTQVRSQLTAAPLADSLGLPVEVRDGIREIAAGDLEGHTDQPSVHVYVSTFLSWVEGDLDVRMPGSEDGHDVLERFGAVVAEAEQLNQDTVAFVSHGAVIRTWAGRHCDGLDTEFFRTHFVKNTGYVIVEGSTASGWRLEAWRGGGEFDTALDASPAAVTEEDPA
jgi:probable phosphoglycerate mutase